jgi:starvation-inducible DNA-binding protein
MRLAMAVVGLQNACSDEEVLIMATHPTRIDLSPKVRTKVCELLNARLADAIDLASQVKQAHWNVKGPNFISLHELFDRIHAIVNAQVDEVAERITALGGVAAGTVAVVARASSLKAYPMAITRGTDHVDALSKAFSAYGAALRKSIGAAAKAGDEVTADLFTGMTGDIDKQLWFLEAHQQADG